MSDQVGHAARIVRCRCGDTCIEATYAIEGRFLVLTSPFGVNKTVLGLQDPGKLARRLFKRLCVPACAKECSVEPATVGLPDAAVIDAVRPVKPRRRRSSATAGVPRQV